MFGFLVLFLACHQWIFCRPTRFFNLRSLWLDEASESRACRHIAMSPITFFVCLFVYSFSFCGAVPSRCSRSTYQLCIWTSITLRHQEHSMDVRNNTIRKREHKEQSRIRHNSSRSYRAHWINSNSNDGKYSVNDHSNKMNIKYAIHIHRIGECITSE